MDWISRLNSALNYIEENLTGEIDPAHVAKLAYCSSFHFQRMFSYIAGVSLWEYIRRRRMTMAAFDLQHTGDKVIDIALRYGYDSPTAFNRAFQGIHGVAPSAARQQGVRLKAYQPISFKITIRGEVEMDYRIETLPAFRTVGVKMQAHWSAEKQESFQEIPLFWREQMQKGIAPALCGLMNREPMGLLGICAGEWQTSGSFDYYIAASSTMDVPEGMTSFEVPACTWAIFTCKGPMPAAIQSMQQRIVTEWLPTSGYEYADAPDIEQYTQGDQQSEEYICYIWLPVRKAAKP